MPLKIYAGRDLTRRSGPRLRAPTSAPSNSHDVCSHRHDRDPRVFALLDARILAVLESPPHAGETVEVAFRRKEHELATMFEALPAAEARALHRRLVASAIDDAVVASFHRLVAPRRERLLAFLADAPRREARRG